MLKLVESSFERKTPYKDKITLLQSITNLQLFASPDNKLLGKILLKIKVFMEDATCRLEGLLLLSTFTTQCSNETFCENVSSWTQYTLQALEGNDGSSTKEMACTVMKYILSNLRHFPEMKNEVAEKFLPAIVKSLIKTTHDDQWLTHMTDCLATCMKEMPKHCVPFKIDIERFLGSQLDCISTREMEPIAECYRFLPSICERSMNSGNYTKHWTELAKKMLCSLRKIMNSVNIVFSTEASANSSEILGNSLEMSDVPAELATLCYSRRFQTISHCLAKMLCSKTDFFVHVPFDTILSTVDQCLSLSFNNLKSSRKSDVDLGTILPALHCSSLIILEALLLSCHDHLFPNEAAIGKLLLLNLSSSVGSKMDNADEINCSMLRCMIYRVMRVWIDKLHPVSLSNTFNELHGYVLEEITPILHDDYLGNSSMYMNGRHESIRDPQFCNKISACTEALQLLSSIVQAGDTLRPSSLEVLQNEIINIAISIQQSSDLDVPYCDERCRQELYRLLLNMVLHCDASRFTSLSMSLFRTGQRDSSLEVSRLCFEATAACIKIIHPKRAVFVFTKNITHQDSGPNPVETLPDAEIDESLEKPEYEMYEDHVTNSPNQTNNMLHMVNSNDHLLPVRQEETRFMSDAARQMHVKEEIEVIDDIDDEEGEEDEEDLEDEEMQDGRDEEGEEDVDDDENIGEEDEAEDEEVVGEEQEYENFTNLDERDFKLLRKHLAKNALPEKTNDVFDGPSGRIVKVNGFESTGEDSNSVVPCVQVARKRPIENEESEEEPPLKISANVEMHEDSHISDSSEMPVHRMLQDFNPCSPDHSTS